MKINKTKEKPRVRVTNIHDVDEVDPDGPSFMVDDDEDEIEVKVPKVMNVVLFGLEAHTCIQLTALDLLKEGNVLVWKKCIGLL